MIYAQDGCDHWYFVVSQEWISVIIKFDAADNRYWECHSLPDLKILNCSKSSAAQLSGFSHEYTSMRKNIDNEASQRCRFSVPDQKTFGKPISMSICQCILDTSVWKNKKNHKCVCQFLRQSLRKGAKSDRNLCIWSQLLCDLTGMKHHNIHKTTKNMFFFTKNHLKKYRYTSKIGIWTKNLQKTWKFVKNWWFFLLDKNHFFVKKITKFSQKNQKKCSFLGERNF